MNYRQIITLIIGLALIAASAFYPRSDDCWLSLARARELWYIRDTFILIWIAIAFATLGWVWSFSGGRCRPLPAQRWVVRVGALILLIGFLFPSSYIIPFTEGREWLFSLYVFPHTSEHDYPTALYNTLFSIVYPTVILLAVIGLWQRMDSELKAAACLGTVMIVLFPLLFPIFYPFTGEWARESDFQALYSFSTVYWIIFGLVFIVALVQLGKPKKPPRRKS